MARVVKEEEYTAKRNEILDSAARLLYTKGYERMAIQDILNDLQISKGAFYHYFDSKSAVLEAFTERIREETEKPLLPIIDDSQQNALQKLQGFFGALDRIRIAYQHDVVELMRVWYTDENALVRQKVDEAVRRQRAPLLTRIIRQGIEEGLFTNDFPDQSGEVLLALLHSMENRHAGFLIAFMQDGDGQRCIDGIVLIHAAYMDAVERILGIRPHALYRVDAEAVMVWLNVLRANS